MIKFNKEIKDQWVAALRSGDYSQGGGRLYRPEEHRFCVLGVLGDLNDLLDGKGHTAYILGGASSATLYDFIPMYVQDQLLKFNDIYALSFNELADIIEGGLDDEGQANERFEDIAVFIGHPHGWLCV